MLIVDIVILVAGFFALIKGADWFVDGSSGIARRFHVPQLIIGLTIVALGTSAPELAVSTSAALQGSNEIALSNVVGSNIFNLLCVLGVCALFRPVPVDKGIIKRDFPLSIAATVAVFACACAPAFMAGGVQYASMEATIGTISRPLAAALVVALIVYLPLLVSDAKRHPAQENEDVKMRRPHVYALMIVLGLALIILGGQAVVHAAQQIARAAGMTETLIGLTIVAVGTSLPELVTSVVAAKKGETGLALGNVLGSNLFNMLLILGVSALIHPITVNLASAFDLAILTVVSVIAFVCALTASSINRLEGAVMVCMYVADVVFAIVR